MKDSLTLRNNSVVPLTNGSTIGGTYSTVTMGSSYSVSDLMQATNAISETSTMASGLHENLFLQPEVHNPVRRSRHHHSGAESQRSRKKRSNGYFNGGIGLFGQVTVDITADELISEGVAATKLCWLLGPFVFLMSLAGLYHPSSEDVAPSRDSCCSGGWCCRWLLTAWSVLVGLFLLFNVVVIGYYVDVSAGLDVLTGTEILLVLRLLKALVILVFFLIIFESSDRYEEMLETWCIWLRWQTGRITGYSRKWIWFISCLTVIYAAVPSVFGSLSVYRFVPHMGLHKTAFILGYPAENLENWHWIVRITFSVAHAFSSLIISLFCGFFSAVCFMLQHEMRLLAREIQVEVRGHAAIWDMKIEPLSGQEVTVLEFLRRKHGKITAVIRAVDHSFRELLFFHYVFGIPKIVFGLYLLLTGAPRGHLDSKGTILLFVIAGFFEMFVVWLAAVKVNTWAHQPANILPAIDIHEKKEVTHAHQTSLGLFMSSLTTDKIAMTLWGMIPLTKAFLIMMILFVVTYLIILVDLSPMTQRPAFQPNKASEVGNLSTESIRITMSHAANVMARLNPTEISLIVANSSINVESELLKNSSDSFWNSLANANSDYTGNVTF